jgi:hypothetical protein
VSGVSPSLVAELMRQSLAAWRVAGTIDCGDDGAITIAADKPIRIAPAPNDTMVRWLVTVDGRSRAALSLVAVLRQVRLALDPDYEASRLRIAAAPLLPPGSAP